MSELVLSEFSRRAMATQFVVMLPGTPGKYAEIAIQSLAEAERIEALLSVYRADSDVSRLNLAAGSHAVRVSPDTFAVLRRGIELSRFTGGAFDMTAGPLVEAWGFTQRQAAKPSDVAIAEARHRVGFEKLILDDENLAAELTVSGMAVNLGAIGKGFALDVIAGRLVDAGVADFLLHGGQSSVLVRGDSVPGSGEGWKVAIPHPQIPERRLGGLRLRNQAIGTSGSGNQFFHHHGKRLGHVIDPRTGWPAGDLLSLTVVSDSAMDADAIATGLFVLGSDEALKIAERSDTLPLGFVAIAPTTRQADVVIRRCLRDDAMWLEE